MYKKKALVREDEIVLVSTAREGLPALVHRVSHGGKPVKIGPRGKPAAVLMGIDDYEALSARARTAKPATWADLHIEIVGTDEELEEAMRRMNEENIATMKREVARTARLIERPVRTTTRRRRK